MTALGVKPFGLAGDSGIETGWAKAPPTPTGLSALLRLFVPQQSAPASGALLQSPRRHPAVDLLLLTPLPATYGNAAEPRPRTQWMRVLGGALSRSTWVRQPPAWRPASAGSREFQQLLREPAEAQRAASAERDLVFFCRPTASEPSRPAVRSAGATPGANG